MTPAALAVLDELRAVLRGTAPDRRQRVEPVAVERRQGPRRGSDVESCKRDPRT